MDATLLAWLPLDTIEAVLAAPLGELWVALAFFAITASAYASGLPGTLLPISFSSGMLLGVLGTLAVGAGVLIGAQALYFMLERGSRTTLREKYGEHLSRLDGLIAKGGIFPLIGLRLAGMPHIAVTALCALAAVGPRRYAVATAVGVLPAVTLSSMAGMAL